MRKTKRHKKSHRIAKSIRYYAARRMLALFSFLPSVISLSLAQRLSTIIGRIGYYFPGTYRKQAMANLKLAFGEKKSLAALRQLMRKTSVEVTKTVFEFVYYLSREAYS